MVSWHPVLTDHQSYTLAALQEAGNCVLKVYVGGAVHAERQAQGWVNPHASSLSPSLIPRNGWLRFVLKRLREHRDAVHLFGSPFEQTRLMVTLLLAVALGRRVFLISEPYSPKPVGYLSDKRQYINWLKAKLRPHIYGFYGALLRRRIDGVFAISCRAVSQYQSIGIAKERIFPFGYFIPRQELPRTANAPIAEPMTAGLRIAFVGSLIATKGLDIMISAVRELNNDGLPVSVDAYGPGDPNKYAFDQEVARYCGVIPFGNAQAVISKYHVLVLPSRYDGWGVVVNEALMAGVPVICSDQVGSGAVIEKWQCGAVFISEDESDLRIKLKEVLLQPAILNNMRLATGRASASLDPKVAGQYMFDIISQSSAKSGTRTKLECPWYECQ